MAQTAAGPGPTGRPKARAGGRARRRTPFLLLAGVLLVALCGCDPLTVHKVTSTIFDGVPSMPPADQYCQDFHEKAVAEELAASKKQVVAQKGGGSQHPPFAEKRCSNCHDKNTESGFVTPAERLCGHCHKAFPRGEYLHGPAAVGACLKCHVPHSSDHPNLLVKSKKELCIACHEETRVAEAMHTKVIASGMYCSDCHDPHGGSNRYFLR